jgi:hypothetical protein
VLSNFENTFTASSNKATPKPVLDDFGVNNLSHHVQSRLRY